MLSDCRSEVTCKKIEWLENIVHVAEFHCKDIQQFGVAHHTEKNEFMNISTKYAKNVHRITYISNFAVFS